MCKVAGKGKHRKDQNSPLQRKTKKVTSLVFKLCNAEIEKVDKYRYLGVILNYNGNDDLVIEQLAGSASTALGQVIFKNRDNMDLGYDSYTKLFEACVIPILDYGCGGWCTENACIKLDNVQNRVIRFYCGLPKNTSLTALTGEMGWTPGLVRRDVEVLRLYNQIIKMDSDRLTRQVFEYDLNLPNGCWTSNLRSICTAIGEPDCIDNQRPVKIKESKQKLMQQYEMVWPQAVNDKPKLRIYAKITNGINVASHLKCNLSKKKRSLVSRLRCGNLQLSLEMGRYNNIPIQERVCKLCKISCEDENHFLFDCPSTNVSRINLYDKHPELLHQTNNHEKIRMLCNLPYTFVNYVDNLWSLHSDLLRRVQ